MVKTDTSKNIRDAFFLSIPQILTLLLEKVSDIEMGDSRQLIALALGVLLIIANRAFREDDTKLTPVDDFIF